jgi:hypothetical protein
MYDLPAASIVEPKGNMGTVATGSSEGDQPAFDVRHYLAEPCLPVFTRLLGRRNAKRIAVT